MRVLPISLPVILSIAQARDKGHSVVLDVKRRILQALGEREGMVNKVKGYRIYGRTKGLVSTFRKASHAPSPHMGWIVCSVLLSLFVCSYRWSTMIVSCGGGCFGLCFPSPRTAPRLFCNASYVETYHRGIDTLVRLCLDRYSRNCA